MTKAAHLIGAGLEVQGGSVTASRQVQEELRVLHIVPKANKRRLPGS